MYRFLICVTVAAVFVAGQAKADSLESGDEVSAEISRDGETWTLLESWSKEENNEGYRRYHYDISEDGLTQQLSLRFRSNMDDPEDYFFLDGIRIAGESDGADDPA